MRNNIYIFGAGASVHVGGPLTKDFIREGFSMLCNKDIYRITEDSFYKVAELIDILYNKDIKKQVEYAIKRNLVSITESYSFLSELSIEELLSFLDTGIKNNDTWLLFKEYQNALYDFVFETLDNLMKGAAGDVYTFNSDGTINHMRNYYDKLVDYIIDLESDNTFITFNYDLLLDTAVSVNNHRILGNYNLPFSSINNFHEYEERFLQGKPKKGDVDILKLHGSLNWSVCQNCGKMQLSFYNNYKSIREASCGSCSSKVLPVLIPPVLRKDINQYGLSRIWEKAEEKLVNADIVTIIGYSFPDADIEAKWLIKSSIAKGAKQPKLAVVDKSKPVRTKIKNLFGDTVSEITEYESFEEYCNLLISNRQ